MKRYAKRIGVESVLFISTKRLSLYVVQAKQELEVKRSELRSLLESAVLRFRKRLHQSPHVSFASLQSSSSSSSSSNDLLQSGTSKRSISSSLLSVNHNSASSEEPMSPSLVQLEFLVTILDASLKSKEKRSLEGRVIKKLSYQLRGISSKKPFQVLCTDVPFHYVKEVASMTDRRSNKVYVPSVTNVRVKTSVQKMINWISKELKKGSNMLILWSVGDNKWTFLT